MRKINYNKIELQPFGKKSIRIVLSVLEDIKVKMELQQTNKSIIIRYGKKVDDITESERRHAIDFLIKNNIIILCKSNLSIANFFKDQLDNEFAIAVNVDESRFKEIYKGINNVVSSEDKDKINKQDIHFYYDEKELFINGVKIKVAERKEETIACMILNYLLNNAENFTAFYSEIMAFNEGTEINNIDDKERTKLFKGYNEACNNLNNKIRKQTPDKIDDFLDVGGSKRGSISINKDYRPIIAR